MHLQPLHEFSFCHTPRFLLTYFFSCEILPFICLILVERYSEVTEGENIPGEDFVRRKTNGDDYLALDLAGHLYKRHRQGALARSGASLFVWMFLVIGFFSGTVDRNGIIGISAAALFLILMNIPTLWILKRIRERRIHEYFSLLINALEIFGYTAVIYFAGGIRSGYLILMYAAVISYVGVAAPQRVTFFVSGLSIVGYSIMAILEHGGVIAHQNLHLVYEYGWNDVVMSCLIFGALLGVVAFMAAFNGRILKRNRDRLRYQNIELEKSRSDLARATENLEEKNLQLEEAMEKVRDSERQKSQFLTNMSHEIRTPMNAVIGMTTLLGDTRQTAEQREYTAIIRNSGELLLTIINDILDFSKIEADKLELEIRPFNIRECVEGVMDLLSMQSADKGLELACSIDENTPVAVKGDVTRLGQILVNIVNNAIKFTQKGEVILSVKPLGKESDDSPATIQLHFSIKDTGIGIPGDRRERLFKSFGQVDASTTRRYGGTGLGLAISKRLVEMMGGTLWVESREGKGSTFHFSIRAEVVSMPTPLYEQGTQPDLTGKRLLIVDDNATNRRILNQFAKSWGMESKDTGLPLEALSWIRSMEPFDAALLDMQMPEMDGLSLAGEIRKERDAKELPLIMLSSMGQSESEVMEAGFAASLTKPVKAPVLFNTLTDIFSGTARPTNGQAEKAESVFDPEMGRRQPLKILLAEDNTNNQKLALRLLERMGYKADVAGNGREAIQSLRRQHYDVVLMDIQMPEMDGLEATRIICSEWPENRLPRIIAMTASVLAEDRESCKDAGMHDYVTKPIRVTDLVSALGRCRPLVEMPVSERVQVKEQIPAADSQELETDRYSLPSTADNQIGEESSPAEGALDPKALANLKNIMGGDEYVEELIDSFLEEAPEMLADMQAALGEGDNERFRRLAHSLKSNSAEFGARMLSDLLKELEYQGKTGALDGALEKVVRANSEYIKVKDALMNYRLDLLK